MSNQQDRDPAKSKRAAEAANIVRRLDEVPDDPQALADKAAFLARGAAERRTYAIAERAMAAAATGMKARDRGKRFAYGLLAVLLGALALSWEPVSIALVADHRTAEQTLTTGLLSGDRGMLDAGSAILDETDEEIRSVTLLRGAGFFDVDTDGRRFEVLADDVTVEVLGTAFEVARLPAGVRVTVAEGRVRVRNATEDVMLETGDQLVVSEAGTVQRRLPPDDVARWRRGELELTGLSVAEAATILDRRLPGRIVVLGDGLRSVQLGGALDMRSPRNALETLAATGNAQVVRVSPLLTVLYSRQ
ncbi:MAG: FecR domain-containing protein [Pseudomonadota bacterium]